MDSSEGETKNTRNIEGNQGKIVVGCETDGWSDFFYGDLAVFRFIYVLKIFRNMFGCRITRCMC